MAGDIFDKHSLVSGMKWFYGIGMGDNWELSWQLTNHMSIMTSNWFHQKVQSLQSILKFQLFSFAGSRIYA